MANPECPACACGGTKKIVSGLSAGRFRVRAPGDLAANSIPFRHETGIAPAGRRAWNAAENG